MGYPLTPVRERLLAAAICAGLCAALAVEAWQVGVTVDEPAHLISSYLYWGGADRLPPQDMPPLIKLAGGWVPRLMGLPLPADLGRGDAPPHEWNVALDMMGRMEPVHVQRVFFWSRLPLLVFPLLTALLLWRWARQLFGPAVGLFVMALYAVEPTALAHGALFKNDAAATFGHLLFWYRAWRYWKKPGCGEAAWLGAALLAAILAKLSMLVLAAIAPLLLLARWISGGQTRRTTAACLVLVLLVPYAGALAAYQFDTRRMSQPELAAHGLNSHLPAWFIAASHVFRVMPIPRRLWNGCASLFDGNAGQVSVYLLGKVYDNGHPLYFPVALAVKIPAPVQMLLLSGIALCAVALWRRRLAAADALWIIPGFLYIALASQCSFQLGVRLVLPALPFGLLLCGVAVREMWRGRRRWIPVCLGGWLAATVAINYPHGISFMNVWAGGPDDGLKYLADSNVDWGQALPDLAEFVRERGIRKFRLSYFGTDNPFRFFRDGEVELVAPPWSAKFAPQRRLRPKPGYYAISASLLPGQLFEPQYRDFYAAFRRMEPIAKVADSIYMYRVGL